MHTYVLYDLEFRLHSFEAPHPIEVMDYRFTKNTNQSGNISQTRARSRPRGEDHEQTHRNNAVVVVSYLLFVYHHHRLEDKTRSYTMVINSE